MSEYSAQDMATAAAQGFREGVDSVRPAAAVVMPERKICDDGYPSDDAICASAWNAALDEVARLNQAPAEQSAMVVPEGWQLVPVEPTPEMLDAAIQDGICVDGKPVWKKDVVLQAKWRYQQMLASAPAPEQPAKEQDQ